MSLLGVEVSVVTLNAQFLRCFVHLSMNILIQGTKLMAEVVTGSLDALHFWEVKTWNTKRTVDPFPSTPCQLSSITWNQSSILINAHSVQ